MPEKYDIVIIGAGPAGYSAGILLAAQGKKTLVVDRTRESVGGVCLNEGCIPTKALLSFCEKVSLIKNAGKSGISCALKGFDLEKLQADIAAVRNRLRDGIFFLFKKHGVQFLEGEAVIKEKGLISVSGAEGEKEISCTDIIIASGSRPVELEALPFDGKSVISSREAVSIASVPRKVLIVGGGSIGIEFSEIFGSLGSEVTIIEMEKNLLPREDSDIGRQAAMYLKKKGVGVLVSSRVVKAEKKDSGLEVQIDTPSGEKTLSYDAVLVAAGRKPGALPCSSDLIQQRSGFIPSDRATRKYTENIYAIGDASPGPMLAHKAYFDAEVAAGAIAGRLVKVIDQEWIPRITYSMTEAACAGFSEDELKKEGKAFKVSRTFFKANGRALASGEDAGLIKLIADEGRNIIGAHIFGPCAGEMLHTVLAARQSGLGVQALRQMVFAHPTYSEIIKEAAEEL